MESGRTPSTAPPSFPAVKHLVWALVAGTALVMSGLRDDRPPQPPTAGSAATATAPASAPASAAGTAAPVPSAAASPVGSAPQGPGARQVSGPAGAPLYLSGERQAPEPPSYLRRPSTTPAPLSRPPYRPAPLAPLRTGPAPTSPPDPAPAGPSGSPSTGPVPARTTAPRPVSSRPAVRPLPPSTPLRLRIPAIKVDAPMMKLALNATGALVPPPDNNPVLAGWYAGGTVPGAVGTAVTAGHVDTSMGPGVFHGLGSVRKGATVDIVRADGRIAVFTVYAVGVYDKADFPDEKVYGPSSRPELRVITCGGPYDKKSGYQDNVVLFAAMTATR
ncbi:class F sortase [Streptomyces sp. NPDC087894]|uniref:class F sortase n=1 Tax=Streptomyces sp. NPDC087894 TaxID=3365816 RepID=UPI00380ED0F0